MKRIVLATIAIASLVLGGQASADSFSIVVTRAVSCSAVTVTATGYGLATDSAWQLVSGRASAIAPITRTASGVPTATATFAASAVGENGSAVVRTRYGGYVAAGAEVSPGSPLVAAELIAFRTCP